MNIDRSNWKHGDRISWFLRPRRGQAHRTGTVARPNFSRRTGLSWVVEVDQEAGKLVIVNPEHEPLLMKQWKEVQEGETVRLPPDPASGDRHVLVGRLHVPPYYGPGADPQWFALLMPGRTEVPINPEDEVAVFPKREDEGQH